jgi:hypothetical protein
MSVMQSSGISGFAVTLVFLDRPDSCGGACCRAALATTGLAAAAYFLDSLAMPWIVIPIAITLTISFFLIPVYTAR